MPRFHRFFRNTLAKLTDGEKGNWDLFLTQALGTIRFSIKEVTRFSPYFLLFGRNVILPIDNLLKPRRKYVGEDFHRIILQYQHKIFMQAKQRIKCTQKNRNERINMDRKEVVLKIGDPVYDMHRIPQEVQLERKESLEQLCYCCLNNKVKNYVDLVKNYDRIGCRMFLKVYTLHTHLDKFK